MPEDAAAAAPPPAAAPSTKTAGAAAEAKRSLPWWAPVVLLALLGLAPHFAWYATTPLGRFPVLDGREMLDLAAAIARGEAGTDLAYRPPLYPALLALPIALGLPEAYWPDAARGLNLLCHLASVLLVVAGARLLGATRPWALAAAGLYALYPVTAHELADPMDTGLSIALLLGGLVAYLRLAAAQEGRERRRWAMLGGLVWALAALTRGQLLVPALAFWPLAVVWHSRQDAWPQRWATLALGALSWASPFLGFGLANVAAGSGFLLLPTQGGYNLYTANTPEQHGRYFVQSVETWARQAHENPNRIEATARFENEIGGWTDPPTNREVMISNYWTHRTLGVIAADPAWWLGHLAAKGYYLLHPIEQYNNKTYAVHAALSPALRWNPLGFGLVLPLAAAALTLGWPHRGQWGWWLALAVLFGALLLGFASGRFRLLLVAPLLLATAAGWSAAWAARRAPGQRLKWGIAAVLAVGAIALGWTRWGTVEDTATPAEDYTLLASSAMQAGRDAEALHWVAEARRVAPAGRDRTQWQELALIARFNLWQAGAPGATEPTLDEANLEPTAPASAFIRGVIFWRHRQAPLNTAMAWFLHVEPKTATVADCWAAILWTDIKNQVFADLDAAEQRRENFERLFRQQEEEMLAATPLTPALVVALEARGLPMPPRAPRYAPERLERARQRLHFLLGPPAPPVNAAAPAPPP